MDHHIRVFYGVTDRRIPKVHDFASLILDFDCGASINCCIFLGGSIFCATQNSCIQIIASSQSTVAKTPFLPFSNVLKMDDEHLVCVGYGGTPVLVIIKNSKPIIKKLDPLGLHNANITGAKKVGDCFSTSGIDGKLIIWPKNKFLWN
jgi:hypothetical protein